MCKLFISCQQANFGDNLDDILHYFFWFFFVLCLKREFDKYEIRDYYTYKRLLYSYKKIQSIHLIKATIVLTYVLHNRYTLSSREPIRSSTKTFATPLVDILLNIFFWAFKAMSLARKLSDILWIQMQEVKAKTYLSQVTNWKEKGSENLKRIDPRSFEQRTTKTL